tara:strand:+ start:1763 stop:2206 length:444 start_codon:yes stop_codon:yes gene_type:complete
MVNKKKGKNNKNKRNSFVEKRTLFYPEDLQEYGKITNLLGDRRINVMLADNTEVLAIIPGKFRKRCWMKVNDIIIVSKREFQEDRWDVCYKYNDDEIRQLAKEKEIPNSFLDNNITSTTDIFIDSEEENQDSVEEENSSDEELWEKL